MDSANGVGAPKMKQLAAHLADAGLVVDIRNTGEGVLNGGCGSDFLQKDRQLPAGFAGVPTGARCCAVDGDSDRLIYFTPLEGGTSGACMWVWLAGWLAWLAAIRVAGCFVVASCFVSTAGAS